MWTLCSGQCRVWLRSSDTVLTNGQELGSGRRSVRCAIGQMEEFEDHGGRVFCRARSEVLCGECELGFWGKVSGGNSVNVSSWNFKWTKGLKWTLKIGFVSAWK